MQIKDQTSLHFHGVNIFDLHFTSKKVFIPDGKNKIEVNIIPKAFFPKESTNKFSILMDVNLSSKDFFELSLFAVGDFEINGEQIENIKQNFINVNAPAIMFPYLRSFISTLTANLGISTGTLTIPPQFFAGTLELLDEEDFPNIPTQNIE